MKAILIVDDEPRTREGIRKTLESWSSGEYQLVTASSGVEALDWLRDNEASLLITDVRMPQIGGLDLIEKLNGLSSPPVVIVISGHADFEYAQRALKFGVVDYLLKPIEKTKLIQAVEIAIEREERLHRIERMEKLVDPKLMQTMEQENGYSPPVREAIHYMEGHLHESVSLRELADLLHMNSSYFSVVFKEQTGLTFSEYLTKQRIQRAKVLLTATTLPISEIAEKVGYQTSRYFVKVFREMEQISPGQYRQRMRDQGQTIT